MEKIFNVSLLNQYIKNLIEGDFKLANVLVVGEVCNLNKHYTGHYYFSIKDENSKISCMMFSFNANKINFDLKNGDLVLIKGYISVYEKNGNYQLYALNVEPYGKGKELLKLEELKKKLKQDGILDLEKKKIKQFPNNIGIITSKSGAAVRDIIHSIQSRYNPQIYVFPCLVQGENAPESIKKALINALSYDLDTIIIARGGGANEDLSAFNDEDLVRYVAYYPLPVITAIGHQIDSSILDLVSSFSCITPTEAGVRCVPDKKELIQYIENRQYVLSNIMRYKIDFYIKRLFEINSSKGMQSPLSKFEGKIKDITLLENRLNNHINNRLMIYCNKLEICFNKLNVLNPYALLNKGYSMIYKEDNIITNVEQVDVNDHITIKLKNGSVDATVKEIFKGE